jgi:hypothetical protein
MVCSYCTYSLSWLISIGDINKSLMRLFIPTGIYGVLLHICSLKWSLVDITRGSGAFDPDDLWIITNHVSGALDSSRSFLCVFCTTKYVVFVFHTQTLFRPLNVVLCYRFDNGGLILLLFSSTMTNLSQLTYFLISINVFTWTKSVFCLEIKEKKY